ncbi:MAG: formyltransferase family protein [Ruthenibacterium lactatiformans]
MLVSGGGTNLQALRRARRGPAAPRQIALVVSQARRVRAGARAKAAGGLSPVVVRAKGLCRRRNTTRLLAALEKHRIDLVVLAGFYAFWEQRHRRLSQADSERASVADPRPSAGRAITACRCTRRRWTGREGDGRHGAFCQRNPDGGRIMLQKAVDVQPGDTPETLQRRVMEQAEWKLLPQGALENGVRLP